MSLLSSRHYSNVAAPLVMPSPSPPLPCPVLCVWFCLLAAPRKPGAPRRVPAHLALAQPQRRSRADKRAARRVF